MRRFSMHSRQLEHAAEAERQPNTTILPDRICEGLYISSKDGASNRDTLRRLNIDTVIICCDRLPAVFSDDQSLTYIRLPIHDSLGQFELDKYFVYTRHVIDQHARTYFPSPSSSTTPSPSLPTCTNVLVHCNAGISRSGAVVVDYLLHRQPHLTVAEALQLARSCRANICPNTNFMSQLTTMHAVRTGQPLPSTDTTPDLQLAGGGDADAVAAMNVDHNDDDDGQENATM